MKKAMYIFIADCIKSFFLFNFFRMQEFSSNFILQQQTRQVALKKSDIGKINSLKLLVK